VTRGYAKKKLHWECLFLPTRSVHDTPVVGSASDAQLWHSCEMESPTLRIRLDGDLLAWLDEEGKKRDLTRSEFVRFVLERARAGQAGPQRPVAQSVAQQRPAVAQQPRPVAQRPKQRSSVYPFEPADCPHKHVRTDGTCAQCGIQRRPGR